MIDRVLLSVRGRIESALQGSEPRESPWIVLTGLVNVDGTTADDVTGRVAMSLVSIRHDNKTGSAPTAKARAAPQYASKALPLIVDVYVLFVSCFTGPTYVTGIGALSRIIGYLQENPVFDEASSPDIAAIMGRLAIEFVDLDLAAANNLANVAGLKGLPFALYRLRRLPFDGPAIAGVDPAVRRPVSSLRPRG